MKNKHCDWCDNLFQTKLSYQIYCSPECRQSATKEKIAQKYLKDKVKKRAGKIRPCKNCGKQLSIYTEEVICQACDINPDDVKDALKEIKDILNGKIKFD
jgi:methylphosphotriester-DNA--protein-cysteine methyltransferase